MTLADIVSAQSREFDGRDILDDSRIVTIHRDVFNTACDLVDRTPAARMKELSRFTCWPDYSTWMETERDAEGRRMGFMFNGHLKDTSSVTQGFGLIVLDEPGKEMLQITVRYDLERYELRHHPLIDEDSARRLLRHPTFTTDERAKVMDLFQKQPDPITQQILHAPLLNNLKPILFTLLALMNSPKLIRTRPVNLDRINGRRLKQGKYPYHPHHQVLLNVDKHSFSITQGQGDGPERCLHFVRAHLRFLVHPRYKNVSVVLVPPHTRGNPALGLLNTSYAVGKEHSRWK